MISDNKLERFEIIEKIGEGVCGTVFKVKDNFSKKFFALKKIKIEDEDQGVPTTTIREISLLKDIVHSNIIRLFNIIHWNKRLFLVLELADMDLKEFMMIQTKSLTLRQIKCIVY